MNVRVMSVSGGGVLVLGSGSPRRREILGQLGIAHVVRVPAVDEDLRPGEAPDVYLERVVDEKFAAVRTLLAGEATHGSLVLVADTIVVDRGAILGKPADVDEARATIARLAGRTHEVKTRFALGRGDAAACLHAETVTTKVTFRALDDDEIRDYAASGEGTDKAGAYAVQGRGAALVARIEGSYTNVVGLPASELVVALRRHGGV